MDEGTLWGLGRFPFSFSNELYRSLLKSIFRENAIKVEEVYETPNTKLQMIYGEVIDDYLFTCGSRILSRKLAEKGIPVYAYEFQFFSAADPRMKLIGVFHGSELSYVFHSSKTISEREQIEVSQKIVKYWTQFAKTGNPNSEGQVFWKPFTLDNQQFLILDNVLQYGEYNSTRCDLMDSLLEPK